MKKKVFSHTWISTQPYTDSHKCTWFSTGRAAGVGGHNMTAFLSALARGSLSFDLMECPRPELPDFSSEKREAEMLIIITSAGLCLLF